MKDEDERFIALAALRQRPVCPPGEPVGNKRPSAVIREERRRIEVRPLEKTHLVVASTTSKTC